MSLQYGELRPTNGCDRFSSLGHPSKFQPVLRLAFVIAVTSLTWGQPNFARCLAVYWAATLYKAAVALLQNFVQCKIHFTPKSFVLLYWQRYCTALQSAKLCGVVQEMELRKFRRRRHLYLAGRPSRWALAHILVFVLSHHLVFGLMQSWKLPCSS